MKNILEIKELLSSQMDFLSNEFNVKNIGIFGSYVRNESVKGSDIDILVEFTHSIGLIDFIRLEQYLHDLLGISVDLVAKDGIKPGLEEQIISEVIYV
jgi:predicted nucleotidyltransferase